MCVSCSQIYYQTSTNSGLSEDQASLLPVAACPFGAQGHRPPNPYARPYSTCRTLDAWIKMGFFFFKHMIRAEALIGLKKGGLGTQSTAP